MKTSRVLTVCKKAVNIGIPKNVMDKNHESNDSRMTVTVLRCHFFRYESREILLILCVPEVGVAGVVLGIF